MDKTDSFIFDGSYEKIRIPDNQGPGVNISINCVYFSDYFQTLDDLLISNVTGMKNVINIFEYVENRIGKNAVGVWDYSYFHRQNLLIILL